MIIWTKMVTKKHQNKNQEVGPCPKKAKPDQESKQFDDEELNLLVPLAAIFLTKWIS